MPALRSISCAHSLACHGTRVRFPSCLEFATTVAPTWDRWIVSGLVALAMAALCGCDLQTKPAGATGPSTTKAAVGEGFAGKWATRVMDGRARKSRTLEFGGDGRYLECYQEAVVLPKGAPLLDSTRCQQGRWQDLGLFREIHQTWWAVVRDQNPFLTQIGDLHLLEMEVADLGQELVRDLHHGDGLLMARVGDSLLCMGKFLVFRNGWGRLDSTRWVRTGDDIQSLYLTENGIAQAIVRGLPVDYGRWDTTATGEVWVDLQQSGAQSVVQGIRGFVGDKLILSDLEDPGKFAWEGPAGH